MIPATLHFAPANTPPSADALRTGVVDLWLANLHEFDRAEFRSILAEDELQRAALLRDHDDRSAFITARGILRRLLVSYTNCPPEAVQITYGPFGKPRLADNTSNLCFNLSHSRNWAIFAFAFGHEIGIDLEVNNDSLDSSALIAWTRREALAKGTGRGLAASDGARGWSVQTFRGTDEFFLSIATQQNFTTLRARRVTNLSASPRPASRRRSAPSPSPA
jgi:4'-phosphopantetheinyl transferase